MKKAPLFACLFALPLMAMAQCTCPVLIEKVNPNTTQSWNSSDAHWGAQAQTTTPIQIVNTPISRSK